MGRGGGEQSRCEPHCIGKGRRGGGGEGRGGGGLGCGLDRVASCGVRVKGSQLSPSDFTVRPPGLPLHQRSAPLAF